ncbi:MAG: type II toxin-antitoxin system HicB family antitoxin [Anaerolineae bacterium CG03_land_8_20_14_0_80_58_20]|nr:MAG: HicB family protein [Anaerolineae bacterium CG1_02_58_13]PIV28836.1 MAG: type II toxin-antitoxin system HicB family antitoxin [Anaerolineae bacterium CG03_land_8_20_14_0_80_58_20]
MSQIYKLPLVLEPQPEGGYTVTCPLLPELITEGDNVQDALQNANDALAAIVEGLAALGKSLPRALQPANDNTSLWVETVLAVA